MYIQSLHYGLPYAGLSTVPGPGLEDNLHIPAYLDPGCTVPDLFLEINRPIVENLMNCAECTAQCVVEASKGVRGINECAVEQVECVDCAVGRLDSFCLATFECIREGPVLPPGVELPDRPKR